MTNPLLQTWDTPFGLPPFEQIKDSDFAPAVDAALDEARANIAAITEQAEVTFANTIEALENADQLLDRVLSAFYSVAGADTNPEREALSREFAPKLSAYSSEITTNTALFQRIDHLWQTRDTLNLSEEQDRVLYLIHRDFVRAGAQLAAAASDRMSAIKSRLSVLGTDFSQNLLADERTWFMPLNAGDMDGLPDFVVAAANAAGKEKGTDGPVVTTSRSLIMPFLQFSPRRDLRKKAYEAWSARGANSGETDNRGIIAETLKLRAEKAALLGYDTYSAYKLEPEMAGTPEAVADLLSRVWEPAKAAADADAAKLEALLHADGFEGPLEPWDWHYYSEKRRKAEHDLDEAEIKPFFQLDRMIDAAFACANRLFGLEFAPTDGPRYHPDVRLWEVTRNGQHVALFVGDYFARGSKRSGAWCSAMRSQQRLLGDIRPIVVNVCNFAKPAEGSPALLSYDDARTLFHEFGHALHQMLSDVTYARVSGTSVSRDFVELPSQLYEHWLEVPEVLAEFATHAETGEPMPKDLLDRVLGAATYDTGFATVEYVASAIVDLELHRNPPASDPIQAQTEILDRIGLPHAIRMRHASPHFAHAFGSEYYASSYYCYMWAEVMDADAFEAFEEVDNAFDAELAASLEANILSKGGTVDAAELYTRFRGRLPGVEALLKGRGLLDAA